MRAIDGAAETVELSILCARGPGTNAIPGLRWPAAVAVSV
jgi:hypothetical protein